MNTIKYTVKYEDLISRIPALFAYGETNDVDEYIIHKATDALNGCYGKIIENIKLPNNITLIINGEELLKGGETYTYKTLMSYYYQYKHLNNDFISFIDKGVGKKIINGFDRIVYDLVPEYIYLANAKTLYNRYIKLKKQCEAYEKRLKIDGVKPEMCCLCDRFVRMGGKNGMIEFLEECIVEAVEIANEYYSYVDNDNKLNLFFNIALNTSENDMGMLTPYIEEWVAGKTYYSGDKFYYDGETYSVITPLDADGNRLKDENGQDVVFEYSGIFNEETLTIEFVYDETVLIKDEETTISDNNITLDGQTDSKLKSLRRYKEYLNVYDEVITPSQNKDWLFYYRKGLVLNISTLNDELGNISHEGTDMENGNDLYAYGDVIEDIVADNDKMEITFTYWLDVHLTATYKGYDIDDDGNKLYYFSDFIRDENDDGLHGVKYIETFTYSENGELYDLVEKGEFNDYINGKYDGGEGSLSIDLISKHEFSLENAIRMIDKRIGYETTQSATILSNFDTTISPKRDYQKVTLFRNDYYNGITFHPKKDIDVYVNRGITSVFEKHIKFSEVKTLDDMVTYGNSSFFKMISDS